MYYGTTKFENKTKGVSESQGHEKFTYFSFMSFFFEHLKAISILVANIKKINFSMMHYNVSYML